MKRLRLRHVHTSSRFDRSPKSLLAALRYFIERQRADIITLTEVSGEDRAQMMRVPEGWGHARGFGGRAADEAGVMWRLDKWKLVEKYSHLLTTETGGPRAAIYCVTVVLEHRKTGRQVIVTVTHLPAGVEGQWTRADSPRVRAHGVSVREWKRHWRVLHKIYPNAHLVAVADFNLNLHREWVKDYARRTFPRLMVTWLADMTSEGTHHSRLIDWTVTTLRVVRTRVLPHHPSSDHTPYFEVLDFP